MSPNFPIENCKPYISTVYLYLYDSDFHGYALCYCRVGLSVYGVSTIFQLNRGNQCYWWWKPEYYPEKTTDLSQVTDKLDYIM